MALGLSLGIGGSTMASAQTTGVTCGAVTSTSDGHTIYVTCYGGGGIYRIVAKFCNTSSCQWVASNWVYAGQAATISTGGYYSGEWHLEEG